MSAGIEEMATEEQVPQESSVLSTEEVAELTGEGVAEEATLPSDEVAFEMPDKFKGKSAEEIAKSYLELEKMKNKPDVEGEGGDSVSKEEDSKEPSKEEDNEPTKEEVEQYQKYVDSYEKNGKLSDEDYAELAEAGYSKEQVDEEIAYREFRKERAIKDVIEPLGGGVEKFKEVVKWAAENKSPEEIAEFNKALAESSKLGQQALLKGLYAEFGGTTDTTVHTNAPQSTPTKGYSNETEFFNDISRPEYKKDPTYNRKVQEKLAKTDTTGWSF